MIERTVEEMYRTDEANQFLEVTYQNGDKEIMFFKDFSSGAMIENIVRRAKKLAIKRELDDGPRGVRVQDLIDSIHQEYKEHEDLPNTTNPDDWAKISGKKGERIVYVRTLVHHEDADSSAGGRSIEPSPPVSTSDPVVPAAPSRRDRTDRSVESTDADRCPRRRPGRRRPTRPSLGGGDRSGTRVRRSPCPVVGRARRGRSAHPGPVLGRRVPRLDTTVRCRPVRRAGPIAGIGRRVHRRVPVRRGPRHRVPAAPVPGPARGADRVFGPDALWPGRLLSLLIGLLVVASTVVYVRRIAGDRAGFAAGLAVALLPSLIVNDTITLTEPLGLLLVVGILLSLDDRRWILSGALTGLLLLTRPNAYLVVAVVAVVVWRAVGWRRAAAAVGICVVVVAPWAVRNVVQVGTPKLTTSDGFTLAAIYGPPAQETGGFFDPTVAPWFRRNGVTELEHDEAAWSNRLVAIAVDGVRDQPSSVLDRMWSGTGTMLELPGYRAEAAEWVDGRSITFRDATLWLFPLVLVAGSIGTVLRIRDRRTWPAIAIVGQFVAVSLVLVSVPRLRGPFDLLMCVGVGYLWGWFAERREDRAVGQTAVGATTPVG